MFEDAAETPVLADIHALWQQLEQVLKSLTVQEQMRLGGQAIERLAELHQAKAQFMLDEWENAYDPQDPMMSNDWLQGFVRQTQQVDLSELTAPVQRRPKGRSLKPKQSLQNSVVQEVPKANILDMLDQVEAEAQKAIALAVAHEENIQTWVTEIIQWFEHHPAPISLLQLREQLDWPLVQLWLSLLLGEFRLEAMGDRFYNAHIIVSCHPSRDE
jgi:hypothetical protein